MFPPSTDPDAFVATVFPDLDLGDKRLLQRLGLVASACLRHPEEALPDKFHDPSAYLAALDLFNHEALTHDKLLSCHQVAALDLLEHNGPPVALILHDFTDLDFSGHVSLADGLGQIGNGGGKGYLALNSLAVDPDSRAILGLVSQILHVRPVVNKKEGVAAKRQRASRESRLWLKAAEDIGPTPAGKTWVHVADRGADSFEWLQALTDGRRSFVLRSCQSRGCEVQPHAELEVEAGLPTPQEAGAEPAQPADPVPHLLHEVVRTLSARASWLMEVRPSPKRQGRWATMKAAATPVRVRPPAVRSGEFRREAVELWAIRVWEEGGPPGEEKLEWILVTDQDVSAVEDLRRVVGWYECRVVVEEFHKAQKTGMGIEKLQLRDAESLKVAIGLLSVVAVALVNLRVAARDEEQAAKPAARLVPRLWVQVLSVWRYGQVRELTVGEFTLALARLGGHLNRKSDGPPGWITLWRGWERLHTMIDYELARARCG